MRARFMALLCLGLWACGPEFDKQSAVKGPRVLGVVAAPPEIPFDGRTEVTAVLAYPEKAASVRWTWCALNLGSAGSYACAVPEVPLPGAGTSVVFEAAALSAFLDAAKAAMSELVGYMRQVVTQKDVCLRDVIQGFDACGGGDACAQQGFDALVGCLRSEGMDVTLHLRVDWSDGSGVDAYKRVRVRDPSPDRQPNRNPGLEGVEVTKKLVRDGEVTHSIPGGRLEMKAILAEDAVQEYRAADGSVEKERVFMTWYTTSGDFDHIRSTPESPDNTLRLPPDRPDEVTVWVFAHDDRGGASYVRFFVHKRDMP